MYRGLGKGMHVLLSNSHAGPGRNFSQPCQCQKQMFQAPRRHVQPPHAVGLRRPLQRLRGERGERPPRRPRREEEKRSLSYAVEVGQGGSLTRESANVKSYQNLQDTVLQVYIFIFSFALAISLEIDLV